MLQRMGWIAILAAVGAGPALAQSGGERLVSPALQGFVVGHTASNADQSIREEIPTGETVQRWTKMVTTQRFAGLARRTTPADYAQTILSQLPRACPGAKSSAVASVQVSGKAASRFQVDCARSTGGQPETFMLLAVSGAADMHVKQVAFRDRKSAADLAWANDFLNRTALCDARDRRAFCR